MFYPPPSANHYLEDSAEPHVLSAEQEREISVSFPYFLS
jgi:hypothetical protein